MRVVDGQMGDGHVYYMEHIPSIEENLIYIHLSVLSVSVCVRK